MSKLQDTMFEKVKDLQADQIVCRRCGEGTARNSFKGYVHKWGPRDHDFIAVKFDDGSIRVE
jgi:hypothetical protein